MIAKSRDESCSRILALKFSVRSGVAGDLDEAGDMELE